MPKKNIKTEIAVVGAGPVGLIQTIMLAQNDFNVVCIDRGNTDLSAYKQKDGRTTALSYGSSQLLKALGIWDKIKSHACPIKDIKIMDGSSPVLMDFSTNNIDESTEAYGWIIENYLLLGVLYKEIESNKNATHVTSQSVVNYERQNDEISITLEDESTVHTSLVIGADGRQSFTREWMDVGTREWTYAQYAIISIVTHENAHQNTAYEHFKSEGPVAILPMLDDDKDMHRSSVVWTQENENVLNFDNATYLTALNSIFPEEYGEILSTGKRFMYPLTFNHAYTYVQDNFVLIGDAAHGIHPIAGQGLNLGLRDIASLSEVLIKAKSNEENIYSLETLQKYQSIRRPDNVAMAATTDFFNRIFSNNHAPVKALRKIGLKIIDNFKPAKKVFLKQAMGTSGYLPKIIRGE